MKYILIKIIIICLLLQSSNVLLAQGQSIKLPAIPLYIEGDNIIVNNNFFVTVYNKNNAFYRIKITEVNSYSGVSSTTKWVISILTYVTMTSIWYTLLSNPQDGEKRKDALPRSLIVGVPYTAGYLFGLFSKRDDDSLRVTAEYKVLIFDVNNEVILDQNIEVIRDGNTITIGKIVGSIFSAGLWPFTIPVLLFNNGSIEDNPDLRNTLPLPQTRLSDLLKTEGNYSNSFSLKNYLLVQSKIAEFAVPYNSSELENIKIAKLASLGKTKGEFETSIEYQDRIRIESIQKIEIESMYQQQLKIQQEQYEEKRFIQRREIENLIKDIEFSKSYEYSISSYDADRQTFKISIPNKNWIKELVVSREEAKSFKDNISNYFIQERYKPTLDGRWIKTMNDYVLFDKSTNQILSWDGSSSNNLANKLESDPPVLRASVRLIDPNKNQYFDAGEVVDAEVTLSNIGKGLANSIRISLSQQSGSQLIYDVGITIPSIKAGAAAKIILKIKTPQNISKSEVKFKLSFLESQGFEPEPIIFSAETRSEQLPQLLLVDYGINDQNGDGKVTKGESAEITVRIQNKGQGIARNVVVTPIENIQQNIYLAPYSEKVFSYTTIPAGESRDVKFTLLTNNRVPDVVYIDIKIDEERLTNSTKGQVKLEIGKSQNQVEPLVFKGEDNQIEISDVSNISSDIEKNIPVSNKTNPKAVALIIGIREYASNDIPKVEYAKRDAQLMREYLVKVLGYNPKNILPQNTDELMTVGNMKSLLRQKLPSYLRPDGSSDVFIYYAGHGAPSTTSQQPFFVPYDCDPNFVSDDNAYKMSDFYSDIAKLKAKSKTVVIDACFSGQSGDGKAIIKNASPVLFRIDNPLFASKDAIIFQSSESNQVSNWYPEKKHGMFTYFFLKGLKGQADLNKDGTITVAELENYINDENNNLPYVSQREMQRKQRAVVRGNKNAMIYEK